jgi:hypothetical protein
MGRNVSLGKQCNCPLGTATLPIPLLTSFWLTRRGSSGKHEQCLTSTHNGPEMLSDISIRRFLLTAETRGSNRSQTASPKSLVDSQSHEQTFIHIKFLRKVAVSSVVQCLRNSLRPLQRSCEWSSSTVKPNEIQSGMSMDKSDNAVAEVPDPQRLSV